MSATAAAPRDEADAPRSVSRRCYLRRSLPGVYHDEHGGQKPLVRSFLEGIELVLDPIVTLLDNLGPHFDPRLAPEGIVDGLADALGLRETAGLPLDARRRLVAAAMEVAAHRGTREGVERVLALAFPDLDVEVEDSGAVTWSGDPAAPRDVDRPTFRLRCDPPPPASTARALNRLAALQRPAHVGYVPLDEAAL
ncbi:MAG TPA: phage tail protein [Solirubrobacteraceae bacterium]|nr:phage tail protein [Solirubrobacteraceae bacterium]